MIPRRWVKQIVSGCLETCSDWDFLLIAWGKTSIIILIRALNNGNQSNSKQQQTATKCEGSTNKLEYLGTST